MTSTQTTNKRPFVDIRKDIKTAVRQKKPEDIFTLSKEAVESFPEKADEVLDLIKNNPKYIADPGGLIKLWETIVKKRLDLADRFFKSIITSERQGLLIWEILSQQSPTNMPLVKMILTHTETISSEMANNAAKSLMKKALANGIQNPQASLELLDFLVEKPEVVDWTWSDMSGSGNALMWWARLQTENHQKLNETGIKATLKKLLNAGVREQDPVTIKLANDMTVYEFPSIMAMVCWKTNKYDFEAPDVIDYLIDGGVSWEGFDKGSSLAAEHIQKHPVVQAYYRREALGDYLADGVVNEIQKKGPGLKM